MKSDQVAGPEYFQDPTGDWWWRVRVDNGNIVAGSTEGYQRVAGAVKGYNAARKLMIHNNPTTDPEITQEISTDE